MKCLWLDVETTGLDYEKDRIVELGIIYSNDTEEKKFHTYIKYTNYPEAYTKPNSRAIELTGLTPEKLNQLGINELKAFQAIDWFFNHLTDRFTPTDKMILCGYNVDFDDNFLRQLFKRNGGKFYGSFIANCRLNVMNTLALATRLKKIPLLRSYKLQDVAKFFNFEFNPHNALEDILVTKRIQEHLENLLRS